MSIPVLLTFQTHTLKVIRPDIILQNLTTLEEKLALARDYGHIQASIVIDFTPAVAALSATEFMDALRARFNIRGMVVGANFSLGHNRTGDINFLRAYGQEHDIEVQAIELVQNERLQISSTRIRALIEAGQVGEARALLGHPPVLRGQVIRGEQRGRLLGIPTANIVPPADKLLPANGVYAARVLVQKNHLQSDPSHSSCVSIDATIGSDRWDVYQSAVNIGVRPTFDGQNRLVEAYLLDVEGLDLYDHCLSIHFIARLRSEQRFAGIEALKAQIAEDVRNTRQILRRDGEIG